MGVSSALPNSRSCEQGLADSIPDVRVKNNLLDRDRGGHPDFPESSGVLAHPGRGCPVCEALGNIESDCFSRLFDEPARLPAASEAIADSLGFCATHGRVLATQSRRAPGIAAAFSDAIRRTEELLANEAAYDERLQQVFFGARTACPACRFRSHETAAQVNWLARMHSDSGGTDSCDGLRRLCLPHLRALLLSLKLPLSDRLRTLCLDSLSATAAMIDSLLTGDRESAARTDPLAPTKLTDVMRAVAGDPGHGIEFGNSGAGQLAHAAGADRDPRESLRDPCACPVCVEVRRSAGKWMGALESGARWGPDLWIALPTCPEHLWACARLNDPRIALLAAQRVVRDAIAQLHRGAGPVPANPGDDSAGTSNDGINPHSGGDGTTSGKRPKKRQTKREAGARSGQCMACETLAVARDRAIERLLGFMHDRHARNDLESGHGLCMKHFADAYLVAPGAARSVLKKICLTKLGSLGSTLAETLGRSGASAPPGDADLAWVRAVICFSGNA